MNTDKMNDKIEARRLEVNSSDRKSDKKQTATKIFYTLAQLYDSTNANSSRRWIWELIQNAKDLAYEGRRVDIKINLNNGDKRSLTFDHNGKNFNVDQLTYLIKQVSSKDQDDPKVTGKFGTGFLSTHLLSKTITVEGILGFDQDGYTSFEIEMDRDAKTVEEMITKIDKTLSDRDKIIYNNELIEFDPFRFNTSFVYHLNDKSVKYAEDGIADLELCLPYTLLFLDTLGEITVEHKSLTYKKDGMIDYGEVKIYSILEQSTDNFRTRYFAKIEQGPVSISIELVLEPTGEYSIKKMDDTLPCLFCDFPLLGSESLGLPFVINSSSFNPTEPRDGISLSDGDSDSILENKELMKISVLLYRRLLQFASRSRFGSLYNLAKLSKPKEKEWLSREWVKDNIHSKIEEAYLTTPIILNKFGDLVSARNESGEVNIYVPIGRTIELRKRLYDLLKKIEIDPVSPEKLPVLEDLEEWVSILKKDEFTINLKELSELISKFATLSELDENVKSGTGDKWLDEFYQTVESDEETLNFLTDKNCGLKVFANQKGELCRFINLRRDNKIEEALKDALGLLGNDIRTKLISNDFRIKDWYQFDALSNEEVIQNIDHLIKTQSSVTEAVLFLSSLVPKGKSDYSTKRRKVQKFSSFLWSNYPEEIQVEISEPALWERSDNKLFRLMTQDMESSGNIEKFASEINESEENVFRFLQDLIDFLNTDENEDLINLQRAIIFPDQDGFFHKPSELSIDSGIDEDLISILESLDWSIRGELLHNFISVPEDIMGKMDYQTVSEKLTELLKPIYNSVDRDHDEQEACTQLFRWLVDNKDIAEKFFESISKRKERLLSDTIIRDAVVKANLFEELEVKLGIEITAEKLNDSQFIAKLVKSLKGQVSETGITPESTSILVNSDIAEKVFEIEDIDELLVTSGVYDEEGFRRLGRSFRFSGSLQNYNPYERYLWVQELLNRAVDNVLNKLSTNADYNLSSYKRDSITTLTNIRYKTNDISIVVRPNDYKRVIIYYQRELDLLKKPSSQFWVDNDYEQRQITIGHILEAMRLGVILNLE